MNSTDIIKMFDILTSALLEKDCPDILASVMKSREGFKEWVIDYLPKLEEYEEHLIEESLDEEGLKDFIEAVKVYRNRTGCTLLEAKNKCDEYKRVVS
jgi:ribosomal protein L7/L12